MASKFSTLEPRVLFDAAAVTTAVEVTADAEQAGQNQPQVDDKQEIEQLVEAFAPIATKNQSNAVAFIDSRIADQAALQEALPDEVTLIIIDAEQDGVAQISQALSQYQDLDQVYIFSHGAEGQLSLGSSQLDSESLQGQYAEAVASWGQALDSEADILLYGCDVATDEGQQFVQALAAATGADVAASVDDTGNAEFGGDCLRLVDLAAAHRPRIYLDQSDDIGIRRLDEFGDVRKYGLVAENVPRAR